VTEIPSDLYYTADHEWVRRTGDDTVRVGITDFAQAALGDVVFVELPAVGTRVQAGEPCGEIESTKSVSDLYAPVGGEVAEVNGALEADAELVNRDPYGAGWLFRVRTPEIGKPLLSAAEYATLLGAEG
jgi:glycine cleavage system H protein